MANDPTSGVPSQTPMTNPESIMFRAKQGAIMEIPGLFYNQYTPTAATVTSGTVTNSGQSLIGAIQLGGVTNTTLPLGGDAVVTFSSSSGLLVSFTTSSFMPTTLNYDQMPVKFHTASGTLPTGITEGVLYYWQWVSATTGRLALTPNGTAIAYTDAGSGTIYCYAATQYWGSPVIPAGALQAVEGYGDPNYNTSKFPGATITCEIFGHKIGTGTNAFTVTPGLISQAGTFTALTAGSALAAVNAGPFPFRITTRMVIQQYGKTAVASPYTAIAMVRTVCEMQVFSSTSTNTWSTGLWAKTVSLDLSQGYALDVRYIAATPAVGEYMEPLLVQMWMHN